MEKATQDQFEEFTTIETVSGWESLAECRTCGAVVRVGFGSGDGADRHAAWHAEESQRAVRAVDKTNTMRDRFMGTM